MNEMQTSSTKLSGTVSSNSSLNNGIVSSNSSLAGGNLNTYDKEQDPTVPKHVKSITTNDIEKWNEIDAVAADVAENANSVKRLEENTFEAGEATGNILCLEDTVLSEFKEITIDGMCEQNSTTGKQLFDYQNTDNNMNTSQKGDDGWITITYDNTEGTSAKYVNHYTYPSEKLKPLTTYAVILEVKDVTGEGSLSYISYNAANPGQFERSFSISFPNMQPGYKIKTNAVTLEDFTNSTSMTRTFASFQPGKSGSITFRLSVLEDTSTTVDNFVYEPFTNGISPNLSYPQKITTLEKSFDLSSCGKNIFNTKNLNEWLVRNKNLQIVYDNSNQITIEGASGDWAYGYSAKVEIPAIVGKTYTISYDVNSENTSTLKESFLRLNQNDPELTGNAVGSTTITATKNSIWLYLFMSKQSGTKPKATLSNIQLEVKEKATDFETYKESVLNILIPENTFVGKINENLKDQLKIKWNEEKGEYWLYLNKKLNKYVFTGEEDWKVSNSGLWYYISDYKAPRVQNSKIISTHFRTDSWINSNPIGICLGNSVSPLIGIASNLFESLDELKTFLKEKYTNDTPVEAIYELDSSSYYEEPLMSVNMLLTYSEQTNVFENSELDLNINVKYYRDLKKTLSTFQRDISNNIKNIQTIDKKIDDNNEITTNRIQRVEYNLFDCGQASGETIHIKDSAFAEFQEANIDGVCKQVTTSGNQLIDFGNMSKNQSNMIYTFKDDVLTIEDNVGAATYVQVYKDITDIIKNNPGKKLRFKDEGYVVDNNNLLSRVQITTTYSDGSSKKYITIKSFSNGSTQDYEIPTDISNIEEVIIGVFINNSGAGAVNKLVVTKPLLFFDDNDIYEQYTGNQPSPNPDYSQSIEVLKESFNLMSYGKNLFNPSFVKKSLNGTYTYDEETFTYTFVPTTTGINSRLIALVPKYLFEVGKTYKIKAEGSINRFAVGYTTGADDTSHYNYFLNKADVEEVYFTYSEIPTDYVNIYFYNYNSTVGTNWIAKNIQLGLDIDEFEPYQETKIKIEIPKDEFAGKISETLKDQFKIKWNDEDNQYWLYLNKKVKKVVLDGSQSIALTSQSNVYYFSFIQDYQTVNNKPICSHYLGLSNVLGAADMANKNDKTIAFLTSSSPNARFYIKDTAHTSVADFKTWLSEHNIEIYYGLKEPYQYEIPIAPIKETLLTYSNQTNIYTDSILSPKISVEYYRNFKETIAAIQEDISDNALEIETIKTKTIPEVVSEFNNDISVTTEKINNNIDRIDRVEDNLFDSGEASGTSINIKDSALAEFQEITIDGFCKQNVTNGNQLVDFGTQPSNSRTTHTFENDVLTINADGSATYQSFYKKITDLVKNNPGKKIGFDFESFTFENNHNSNWSQLVVNYNDETATSYHPLLTNGLVKKTYTIPDDTSNIKSVDFPIYVTTSPAMENTVKIVKPLLYFDNNNTYEPYSGAEASPNPDYPQSINVIDKVFNVKSCGKNLFDKNNVNIINGFINTSSKIIQSSSTSKSLYIKIEPNKTYSISKIVGYRFSVATSSNIPTIGTNLINVIQKDTSKSITIATGSDEKYLIVWYLHQEDTLTLTEQEILDSIMIEESSIATEYEPYQESKINIPLPDGEFAGEINDTYKDQFRIKWNEEDKNYHVYLEKKIGKTKITTCSNFYAQENNNVGQSIEVASLVLKPETNNDTNIVLKSNYFRGGYSANGIFGNDIVGLSITAIGTLGFGFGLSSEINTKEKCQEFLDNNDVYVYYPLNKPYELDLGSVDMLLAYLGQTNIFINSELNPNMNVKYYRDFKKTISVIQENIISNTNEIKEIKEEIIPSTLKEVENQINSAVDKININTDRINRIENNLYEKGVAADTIINIKDSALSEFQEITVDGVCEQVTTTGKNKWSLGNEYAFTSSVKTWYYINGKAEAYGSNIGGKTEYKYFCETGKTYMMQFHIDATINSSRVTWSDETSDGTQLISASRTDGTIIYKITGKDDYIIPSLYMPENTKINVTKVMIEEVDSSTALASTYEPYTGGLASPRPDWQQPISVIDKAFNIKSVGKNWFNLKDTIIDKTQATAIIIDNGVRVQQTVDGTWKSVIYKITDLSKYVGKIVRVKAKFKVSGENTGYYSLGFCDSEGKNRKSMKATEVSNTTISIEVPTFTNNRTYLYLGLASNSNGTGYANDYTDYTDVIVTIDDTDMTYEPYQESVINIPLPDGEFAGKINETYKDQFKIKWNDEKKEYWLYLDKKVGKDVLDGRENWTKATRPYYQTFINNLMLNLDGSTIGQVVCNYFKATTPDNIWSKNENGITNQLDGQLLRLRIQDDPYTLDAFKDWLSTHNLEVYYALAEPYELDLGSVEMLLTYLGQTNVFTDSELNPLISVKYYRDVVTTIQNMEINEGALKSELVDVKSRLAALETALNNLLVNQIESEEIE